MNDMVSFSTVSVYMRKNKKKVNAPKLWGKNSELWQSQLNNSLIYVFLKAESHLKSIQKEKSMWKRKMGRSPAVTGGLDYSYSSCDVCFLRWSYFSCPLCLVPPLLSIHQSEPLVLEVFMTSTVHEPIRDSGHFSRASWWTLVEQNQ